ncbi:MAG: methyltransferase [Betaproteobacteria bacterium]|nr:methyltransferase [Betaproteobacteria bacterium]
MVFKKLLAALQPEQRTAAAAVEFPLETEALINRLHDSAPLDEHLRILFDGVTVGGENYVDLYRRCLTGTGTPVTPFNVFHRFQSRRDLLQYFFATLDLPGARAECGTYRGATALLLAHAWRSRQPAFAGDGLFLIDSFVGTSASGEHDLIPVRNDDGTARREAFFPVAKADISPELVRSYFREFPGVNICAGWIPPVLNTLPESAWAFVHLDVTLYEPTLAALEHFFPRLTPGGVIICDGSIFCPGAKKAWDEFCTRRNLPFIVLGNRESILIKQPSVAAKR